MTLKGKLQQEAKRLGFSDLGVADPDEFSKHPRVPRPESEDEYYERPKEVWPGCRSVVVAALHVTEEVLDALVDTDSLRAVFYNEVINHRLHLLSEWLSEQGYTSLVCRGISYKRAAVLAGLGHIGKNTLVAHPQYGSNVRFGVMLTDASLSFNKAGDPFRSQLCTGCDRCVSVCPEDALSDYKLDFPRCMVAAEEGSRRLRAENLQKRGIFSVECNLCQKICPLNC